MECFLFCVLLLLFGWGEGWTLLSLSGAEPLTLTHSRFSCQASAFLLLWLSLEGSEGEGRRERTEDRSMGTGGKEYIHTDSPPAAPPPHPSFDQKTTVHPLTHTHTYGDATLRTGETPGRRGATPPSPAPPRRPASSFHGLRGRRFRLVRCRCRCRYRHRSARSAAARWGSDPAWCSRTRFARTGP